MLHLLTVHYVYGSHELFAHLSVCCTQELVELALVSMSAADTTTSMALAARAQTALATLRLLSQAQAEAPTMQMVCLSALPRRASWLAALQLSQALSTVSLALQRQAVTTGAQTTVTTRAQTTVTTEGQTIVTLTTRVAVA